MKVSIEKQSDGGYIIRNTEVDKNEVTGGVYSGGLDGIVKLMCAHFDYKIEYLIEDLSADINRSTSM